MAINMLIRVALAAAGSCPEASRESNWSSPVVLEQNMLMLRYRVDQTASVLHILLHANTSHWFGLGFGEPSSGHMKGADLVTISTRGGVLSASDRYAGFAPSNHVEGTLSGYIGLTAIMDIRNDWTVESASRSEGETVVHVSRALDTGDLQDRGVGSGPVRVLWAIGMTDEVSYHHGHRGSTLVRFLPDETHTDGHSPGLPDHDGQWEIRLSNYTVPRQHTTYACQSFEFVTSGDRHVVATAFLLPACLPDANLLLTCGAPTTS